MALEKEYKRKLALEEEEEDDDEDEEDEEDEEILKSQGDNETSEEANE